MRTICITVNDDTYRRAGGMYGDRAGDPVPLDISKQHFAERGLKDIRYFQGIHATKLGVDTTLTYEVDVPGSGYKMGPKPTGIWLSHRAVWAACLLMDSDVTSGRDVDAERDEFLILEDDALFVEDWKTRFDAAMMAMPRDWNAVFLGSCCAADKPTRHIFGEVYEVKWPMCLQAVLYRRRALRHMILTSDSARCYAPIDISLTFHTFETLGGVYTILPRLVHQRGTEIPA